MVVTPYNVVVIECKNMVGDIEIDATGSFVRTYGAGRRRRREGIYSPITQNKRHVELMKAIVRSGHGAFVQFVQRMTLDDYYHSVVVLANEKTLLSADQAPREIRDKVIRADQLVGYIKRLDRRYAGKNGVESFANMEKRARIWLDRNAPRGVDVKGRYGLAPVATDLPQSQCSAEESLNEAGELEKVPSCPICGAPMVMRTARRGKHKGAKFWGCSTWPTTRCKGIVKVELGQAANDA